MWKIRKARKEHKCVSCKKTIPIGNRHVAEEIQAGRFKYCNSCEPISTVLMLDRMGKQDFETRGNTIG